MSRTLHHRADRSTLRVAPSVLTKGKKAGEYAASRLDAPSNRGVAASWTTWLHDYNGYAKQRKRRRVRKLMKTYGRRVARRAARASTRKEHP